MQAQSQSLSFPVFFAITLAAQLPFRRRSWLAGEQVSEYAACLPMAEAAFFMAAALEREPAAMALASLYYFEVKDHLAHIEQLAVAGKLTAPDVEPSFRLWNEYRIPELISGLGYALERVPQRSLAFRNLLDTQRLIWDLKETATLTQSDARDYLYFWLTRGLVFGYLFPKTTEALLLNWVNQPKSPQRLRVGGLTAQSAPVQSVEQAHSASQAVFGAWVMQSPGPMGQARACLPILLGGLETLTKAYASLVEKYG